MTQLRRILFLLLYANFIKSSISNDFENYIYYKAPILDIDNINMTLAASFPINKGISIGTSDSYRVAASMAICQADKINQKLYPNVNFNGIINIAIQSYANEDSYGQFSTFKLLSNSLYNDITGEVLSPDGIFNLAGFFGTKSSGLNQINSDIFAGNIVPMLNPGTIDQANLENNFAIVSTTENRTFFSIRDTVVYTSFTAVLDLMKAYNWSISGNIYQDDIFGFAAEQYVQTFVYKFNDPVFACNRILTPKDRANVNSTFLLDFCQCMKNIDVLKVVNLWLNPIVAYKLIKDMKEQCSAANDFVFIVTEESDPMPPQISEDPDSFKTTLILRPYGPLNVTQYFNECLETATPQAKTAVNTLLDMDLKDQFNCYRRNETNSDFPPCPSILIQRKEPCLCTGQEYNPEKNSFIVRFLKFLHQ